MSASWQDRLRECVKLSSPSGLVFTPGWRGDKETLEKRVGQFSYPMANGTKTQDMGTEGEAYTLTLLFEGSDNDTESHRFVQALKERGPWTVVHPVDGTLTLQPIGTIERTIDPIESGNITTVTTTWIIPIQAEANKSDVDLGSEVESAADELDSAASDAAEAATAQDTASKIAATVAAVRAAASTVKAATVEATARINAIQNTVSELLAGSGVDMAQIAGAITELMSSPGLVSGSIWSRCQAMAALGGSLIATLPSDLSADYSINQAVVGELVLSATISAMARIITSDLPETRSQALSMKSSFEAFVDAVTTALDAMTTDTADSDLEDQFFGGRACAQEMASLRALVGKYLLSILCDLKVEHRFTLDRPRAPIEIAITEYGADESNVDGYFYLFCRSNGLHKRELLLLPKGREVVIYA